MTWQSQKKEELGHKHTNLYGFDSIAQLVDVGEFILDSSANVFIQKKKTNLIRHNPTIKSINQKEACGVQLTMVLDRGVKLIDNQLIGQPVGNNR